MYYRTATCRQCMRLSLVVLCCTERRQWRGAHAQARPASRRLVGPTSNAAGRSRMLPLPYNYNASRRGMRRAYVPGYKTRLGTSTYIIVIMSVTCTYSRAQLKLNARHRRAARPGPGAGDPPGLARASATNRWARAARRCLSRGLGRIFGGKGGILGRHLRAPFCAHTRPHRG